MKTAIGEIAETSVKLLAYGEIYHLEEWIKDVKKINRLAKKALKSLKEQAKEEEEEDE